MYLAIILVTLLFAHDFTLVAMFASGWTAMQFIALVVLISKKLKIAYGNT